MQKVHVKSIAIKTGTNKSGEWINTRVTGDDDTIFSTFHKSAKDIGEGDLIQMEVTVSSKGNNFDEFTIIEKGTGTTPSPSAPAVSNGGGYKKDIDGMRAEYVMKARLQAIERASIEAQTAYKGIMELVGSLTEEEHKQLDTLIEPAYAEAIAWARSKMAATLTGPAPSEAAGATPEAPQPDPPVETSVSLPYVEPDEPFAHIGALLAWCKNYGIDRATFITIAKCDEKGIPELDVEKTFALVKSYIIERAGAQAEARIFGKPE